MTIEERLANIELQLECVKRRNRWLLGAVLLVAGGLIIPTALEMTAFRARAQGPGGPGSFSQIHTRELYLEDEDGHLRGQLIAFKQGAQLDLVSGSSQFHVHLGVNEDWGALRLSDRSRRLRTELIVSDFGPTLNLYDENGTVQASLAMRETEPALTLLDNKSKGRIELEMRKGNPGLVLFGPDGKVIWSAIK